MLNGFPSKKLTSSSKKFKIHLKEHKQSSYEIFCDNKEVFINPSKVLFEPNLYYYLDLNSKPLRSLETRHKKYDLHDIEPDFWLDGGILYSEKYSVVCVNSIWLRLAETEDIHKTINVHSKYEDEFKLYLKSEEQVYNKKMSVKIVEKIDEPMFEFKKPHTLILHDHDDYAKIKLDGSDVRPTEKNKYIIQEPGYHLAECGNESYRFYVESMVSFKVDNQSEINKEYISIESDMDETADIVIDEFGFKKTQDFRAGTKIKFEFKCKTIDVFSKYTIKIGSKAHQMIRFSPLLPSKITLKNDQIFLDKEIPKPATLVSDGFEKNFGKRFKAGASNEYRLMVGNQMVWSKQPEFNEYDEENRLEIKSIQDGYKLILHRKNQIPVKINILADGKEQKIILRPGINQHQIKANVIEIKEILGAHK